MPWSGLAWPGDAPPYVEKYMSLYGPGEQPSFFLFAQSCCYWPHYLPNPLSIGLSAERGHIEQSPFCPVICLLLFPPVLPCHCNP